MLLVTLLALIPVDIEVHAPGCVERDAVVEAVDAVGGIDVVEQVRVLVERTADNDARLVIELELIGSPPLHREAPLLPVECADVADLTAFLVQQQREHARALPAPEAPVRERISSFERPPPRVREVESCFGTCDDPFRGRLQTSISIGAALPASLRLAVDVGIDVDDHFTPTFSLYASSTDGIGFSPGLQARLRLDAVELSIRGGLGVTIGAATGVGPQAVLRARVGYGFLDVGGTVSLGLREVKPSAFVAVGLAFGGL
jgi:hypothetical protein